MFLNHFILRCVSWADHYFSRFSLQKIDLKTSELNFYPLHSLLNCMERMWNILVCHTSLTRLIFWRNVSAQRAKTFCVPCWPYLLHVLKKCWCHTFKKNSRVKRVRKFEHHTYQKTWRSACNLRAILAKKSEAPYTPNNHQFLCNLVKSCGKSKT